MDPGSVKVFTSANYSRLNYIADLILNDILGLSWDPVTDKRKIGKHPVINYSDEDIPGSFKVNPAGILSEKGIRHQEINVTRWKNLPVFFQSVEKSDFPFDVFAASFYLVTRYEEYICSDHDKYGRYRATDSLAFRNGFLRLPVVELWAREFANSLVRKYPYLAFRRGEYRSVTTIDADEAFRFVGKGMIRTLGGFVHDIISGKGIKGLRFECITKGARDPYDVFDYLTRSLSCKQNSTKFFIPVGNPSEFDENPTWKNERYRNLIKQISSGFETGIHPSFKAGSDFRRMRKEVKRLSSIVGREPKINRFHFLRIRFPYSYKNLITAGIKEDYSMGYSDEPGFRAGISRSFRFYNVEDDLGSNLSISPFQFMDMMCFGKSGNDPESAKVIITELIQEIRKAGGTFTSIWHNTTLLESEEGKKWRDLFEYTLKNQFV